MPWNCLPDMSLKPYHACYVLLNFCRFVRFVSTPEILERVYTLESEILQIEEAISVQSNSDGGLHNVSCIIKVLDLLQFKIIQMSVFHATGGR